MAGHLEVVRVLLENSANLNARYWEGTPLHGAWESGHLEVAQLLLKYGADINALDRFGETLLHRALRSGDQKTARQLLERGANVHAMNRFGYTLLQEASAWGNQGMVQLLLQYGAKISWARTYNHSTDNGTRMCLGLCGIGALYDDILMCAASVSVFTIELLEARAEGRTFIYWFPFSARVWTVRKFHVLNCQRYIDTLI